MEALHLLQIEAQKRECLQVEPRNLTRELHLSLQIFTVKVECSDSLEKS